MQKKTYFRPYLFKGFSLQMTVAKKMEKKRGKCVEIRNEEGKTLSFLPFLLYSKEHEMGAEEKKRKQHPLTPPSKDSVGIVFSPPPKPKKRCLICTMNSNPHHHHCRETVSLERESSEKSK